MCLRAVPCWHMQSHGLYLHGALDDILPANDRVQQLPAGLLCQVPPIAHQRGQLPAAVAATPVMVRSPKGLCVWRRHADWVVGVRWFCKCQGPPLLVCRLLTLSRLPRCYGCF
jgi:hypothetical protein